jgi:hypothetical protein
MYLTTKNAINPATGEDRPMPWEYIEYVMCKDIYHCTPDEFRQQDIETVLLHLAFFNLENTVKNLDA